MEADPVTLAGQTVHLDPLDAVPRIGLILLSTDLTTERDFARVISPSEAGVHATRVAFVNPTTPETLRATAPRLGDATALIVPNIPLSAICFSCTAASVVIGEATVEAAIGAVRPGVPVVTPVGAARQALRAVGARRLAILTPYLPETTAPLVDHFAAADFDVVSAQCLGLDDDREMARIAEADIIEGARAADDPTAEALFISCTALPALGCVARIEAALGKPVVTSNQASAWALRRLAGLAGPVAGYGRLFENLEMQVPL
jgi:maleate isomerase